MMEGSAAKLETDLTKFSSLSSEMKPVRRARAVFLKRLLKNRTAILGCILLSAIILTAIFAPYLAPYNPIRQNLDEALQMPSGKHLLGTDEFGRDILSRIIYGSRISLSVAVAGVVLALVIGVPLGLMAGYCGTLVDNLIMRSTDVLLAFPGLLLAIAITAALGVGLIPVCIAVSIVSVPAYVRLMRASVLVTKELDFVQAARVLGATGMRILVKHILPNSWTPIIVQASLNSATAILTVSGLSFLGLGAQPPTPEWGAMLSTGRAYLRIAPQIATFPGIAIMIAVLGLNLVGDGLRDALDVRMKL
ncbi:MAG: ABC transporter permease [Chloroflexi bacterium]|nr:ABC transporter permease [Chloroflexota bacterium]MCL5076183.1 ABC transporter permease [Chloroflexota bacterium]